MKSLLPWTTEKLTEKLAAMHRLEHRHFQQALAIFTHWSNGVWPHYSGPGDVARCQNQCQYWYLQSVLYGHHIERNLTTDAAHGHVPSTRRVFDTKVGAWAAIKFMYLELNWLLIVKRENAVIGCWIHAGNDF